MSESELTPEQRQAIDRVAHAASRRLNSATDDPCKVSAEIHGLVALASRAVQRVSGQPDEHILLSSQTYQGRLAADLVCDWLTRKGYRAQVRPLADLRTDDIDSFHSAMAELARWCLDTLPGYKKSGYRIVFHATGGFKATLGFLVVIGMLHADDIVYLFESSPQLISIPRLPLAMQDMELVEARMKELRRMKLGLPVTADQRSGLEIYTLQHDGKLALNAFGELLFDSHRPGLYGKRLFEPPCPRVRYGPDFTRSLEGLPPERMEHINERVDDLARFIETGQKLQRFDLKKLKGPPVRGATHEIDAWADADAARIFCRLDGDVWVLERLDKPLH